MRSLTLFCLMLCVALKCFAQPSSEQEKEVLAVINQLFDGMRAGDSTMVKATFYSEVEMYTSYTNKNGEAVLKKDTPTDFFNAVASPHDKVWDERLWDTEVRIDGNLAQVWTFYAFYLGDTFNHCGVDAFHLTHTDDGWKIFHLTDTRQKEGCQLPESIGN